MKILTFIILFSLIIISCDLDVYTGYNFTAQELSETTLISGYVTNYYTDQPVDDAIVRFATQETKTDEKGYYQLSYLLSDDEVRNKPTNINVEKEDYYFYSEETSLFPNQNTLDFQIKLAAPVIVDTRRREVDNILYCQAIVKDYQGIETLSEVLVTYAYLDTFVGQVVDSLTIKMRLVDHIDRVTGYYQLASNPPSLPYIRNKILAKEGNQFQGIVDSLSHPTNFIGVFYDLNVTDYEGYDSYMFHTINPRVPDRLLFDPY